MKKILIFCALLLVFLAGCGKPVEVSPQAEKWEVLPKESIRLVADVTNLYNGTYVSKYFWAIRTPDCGEISCTTCSSVWWTAPAEAPKPRLCTISVEVVLRDSGNSYYEDRATTYFDIKVNPYPVKNKAPVIARFNVPLQFVSPDETISLSVEATDPEGGPLKYRWSATCGKIEGGGTGISWTAPSKVPANGKCIVHVSVEDQEKSATGVSVEFIVE